MSDGTAALYWFVWSNLGQFVEQCADVVAELMILTGQAEVLSKGSEGYGAYPVTL